MDCTAVVNLFAVNRIVANKVENTEIVANMSADWYNSAEGW